MVIRFQQVTGLSLRNHTCVSPSVLQISEILVRFVQRLFVLNQILQLLDNLEFFLQVLFFLTFQFLVIFRFFLPVGSVHAIKTFLGSVLIVKCFSRAPVFGEIG